MTAASDAALAGFLLEQAETCRRYARERRGRAHPSDLALGRAERNEQYAAMFDASAARIEAGDMR